MTEKVSWSRPSGGPTLTAAKTVRRAGKLSSDKRSI
jgi:hypothetical protein